MDITQPDSGQQQPDEPAGSDAVESSPSNEATQRASEASKPGAVPTDRLQRFADVLAEVDGVDERPLADHKDVFTRAHRELTDALNDVERGDS